MNKLAAHFISHWERTLFLFLLLAFAAALLGWHFFRKPQAESRSVIVVS